VKPYATNRDDPPVSSDAESRAAWPLPLLFSRPPDGSVKVVPLNVIQHPLPTARRCFKPGQALRGAVERFSENKRVAVVGTGGMSHQLRGERLGYLNAEFDRDWLDLTTRDPERLADLSHKEIMTQAGAQAVALIMWLVMRGQWCRQSNSCRGVEDLWSGLSPRSVCHGRVLHQLYAQSFWSALQLIIAQSRPSPPNFGAADDRLNGGTLWL
jgi:Catalytic LigB subunit of aromatic ring-opening dioxygenase